MYPPAEDEQVTVTTTEPVVREVTTEPVVVKTQTKQNTSFMVAPESTV